MVDSLEGLVRMDFDKEENADGYKKLRQAGSKIAGAGVGGIIGFFAGGLFGGPEGAFFGATSGQLIQEAFLYVGNEFNKRYMSPRETERIGGVLFYAEKKVGENIGKELTIRSDDFWDEPLNGRAAAIEIIEGVLLAAQREHEEKKLPFFGNLLANIAFDPTIDREQANLLIKIGENITFRQMCILSVFADHNRFDFGRISLRSSGFPYPNLKRNSLFQEAFDLGSKGLLYSGLDGLIFRGMQGSPVSKASDFALADRVRVVGIGYDLYRLMELREIEEFSLDSVISLLFTDSEEE